jgi:type II secretion system protein N
VLFVFCYAIFLYWVFPYDALKDRILSGIERQLGGGLQVSAQSLKPHWFTGVEIEDLAIEGAGDRGLVELVKFTRVKARAALIPLIFGSVRASFTIDVGKGEISGTARVGDETVSVNVEVNDLNLADFVFLQERTGLKFASRIDGKIELAINRQQPVRSTGSVDITFQDLRIGASQLKAGELVLEVPDLLLAKGKESKFNVSLGRGTVTIERFLFAGGDLGLDLKGKVFLSSRVDNYRLNLRGSFSASPKFGEALPFLFIIDSQKQEDGSYPLSVTGRLARPSIKIGTFTVPM